MRTVRLDILVLYLYRTCSTKIQDDGDVSAEHPRELRVQRNYNGEQSRRVKLPENTGSFYRPLSCGQVGQISAGLFVTADKLQFQMVVLITDISEYPARRG